MIPLVEGQATGHQIQVMVDKLVEALPDGAPRAHGVMACLTLAIILIKDGVTPDEIQMGVKGCSEWLCLFLAEPVEASRVN